MRPVSLLLFLTLCSGPMRAQGCSQCAQSLGQTPAPTQTAYRKAIVVLILAGGGVFTAGLVMMRRFR